jgi:hypothetical protein
VTIPSLALNSNVIATTAWAASKTYPTLLVETSVAATGWSSISCQQTTVDRQHNNSHHDRDLDLDLPIPTKNSTTTTTFES